MGNEGAQARQGDPQVIQQEGADLLSNKGQAELTGQYQKAVQNHQLLSDLLTKVGYQTTSRPITNLKNPDTTIKKVVEKRVDEDSNYDLNDVGDISRGRLVFADEKALRTGLNTLKSEAKRDGIRVVKEQDMFTNPDSEAQKSGYKGYHVDLEMPNGQHVEVQLHTVNSYASAMLTHAIYQSYGDNPPKTAAAESKAVADHVMRMNPQQAKELGRQLEGASAPAAVEAQQKAMQVAMGQNQAPHAEPLQEIPGRYQQTANGI